MRDDSARFRGPPTARNHDRKIMMIMPVAVGDRTSKQNQRVVQKRPTALAFDLGQPLDQIRKAIVLPEIDLPNRFDLRLIASMVREMMMALTNIDHRICSIGAFVGPHERADSSQVQSECQRHEVAHQRQVGSVFAWNPFRKPIEPPLR